MLAEAGVGRLVLVDPDDLEWPNVGRHALGAACVGCNKAKALADRIKSDYPHIKSVVARNHRWQDVAEHEPALLTDSDLIVSAMGSWSAEGALNEWHLRSGRRQPVVYGWTESHACAGHAVAIAAAGGCFQCGLTATGSPLLQVTRWPGGMALQREPACGAAFQPNGPTELAHVVALVTELALDCVLSGVTVSTHRIWAGRLSLLESVGGQWSVEWTALAANRLQGGFIEEQLWPHDTACAECRAEAA